MDISVVIPTCNRYLFLKRALRSVYAQTYLPKEVIVVDDGSSDATSKIQEEFPDIRYIYQTPKGVSVARNTGIQAARYEWIAFLDDDDEWEREKLALQKEYHDTNDLPISYTDERWFVNEKEKNIPKKYRKPQKNTFLEHIRYCNIAPSSVIAQKRLLESIGLFDPTLPVCEDYDMWLRILARYPFGYLDKKLIRKHAHSFRQLGFSENIEYWRIRALKKHLKGKYGKDVQAVLEEKIRIVLQGRKKRLKKIDEELLELVAIIAETSV